MTATRRRPAAGFWLLVFSLLLSLWAIGCSDDSQTQSPDGDTPDGDTPSDGDSDGDVDGDADDPYTGVTDAELIELGKQALRDNDPETATAAFGTLQDRSPNHPDALYGLCLADIQYWLGVMNVLLATMTQDQQGGPMGRLMAEGDSIEDLPFGDSIDEILDALQASNELQQQRLDALKLIPDVEFTLDRFPVYLIDTPMMSLGKEWDLADVYMIDAFTKLFYAMITIINSQNWEAIDMPTGEDFGEADGDANMAGSLFTMLNTIPEFLTLKPEGAGEEQFARAQKALSDMADDILTAYSLMEQETDPQGNDVLVIGDTFRGIKHINLHGEFYHPDGTKNEIRLLWEGEKYGFKVIADRFNANLAGEADMRIRVEHEIVAPVMMLLDFIKETMTINEFLQVLGFEVDPGVIGIVDDINSRTAEAVPTTVINLLKSFLFDISRVELDAKAFTDRAVDFRALLPNYPTDPAVEDPAFYHEYECARMGWTDDALEDMLLEGAGELGLTLIDDLTPDLGDSVEVTVSVLRTVDDVETVVDSETLTLSAVAGQDFTYTAEFAMAVLEDISADTGTQNNGTLEMSRTGSDSVKAVYVERYIPAEPLDIVASYNAEGQANLVYGPGMTCNPGGSRDLDHFTDGGDYFTLPDNGPAVLQASGPVLADGYPAIGAYTSYRSGSFNNLLWVDLGAVAPEEWAPEDHGYGPDWIKTDDVTLDLFFMFLSFKVGGAGSDLPF